MQAINNEDRHEKGVNGFRKKTSEPIWKTIQPNFVGI